MKDEEKIDFLRKVELFSSLSHGELHKIEEDITIKNFKKNQTILHEENTNEFMYIILEGEVKAIQRTEEGKEIILAIHRKGEFFGEMSLIDNKTVPATVIAKKDSMIALVSKNVFYSSLVKQNKVLEKLLKILCFRLRESWKTVQMLNFNNASQRIRCLLVMLSNKYGKKIDGRIVLSIKFTHQDIAEMTGMARETVTRVIDELQKKGEIAILKDRTISLSPDFAKELEYTMK
ncbi:MAG TPA: Crp/Fnr family transcriptional regulator [Dissulfurispiraceae bacterium]